MIKNWVGPRLTREKKGLLPPTHPFVAKSKAKKVPTTRSCERQHLHYPIQATHPAALATLVLAMTQHKHHRCHAIKRAPSLIITNRKPPAFTYP